MFSSSYAEENDQEIIDRLIQRSISLYLQSLGNCPCPYNTDKSGRICGKRSAWSRASRYSPLCYPNDITPEMI